MSDQSKPLAQILYESTPSSRQTVKFLTAATIGFIFLVLSGLTLTATVLVLILSTPILVLFSPVLVPAVVAVILVVAGFFFSGGCGATAIGGLWWMYMYLTGKHPPGAGRLEFGREKITEQAREVGEKGKADGEDVKTNAHEVAIESMENE